MKNNRFVKVLLLLAALASSPFFVEAGFFGSDPLASYKGVDLERDELSPVVALLGSAEQEVLRNDKEKLELFVRKELIRKYLIEKARKEKMDIDSMRALQMQLSGENELYRLYMLEKNKLPHNYPQKADIKRVYEKNIQQFKTPEQFHIRQIFLPVNKKYSLKKQLNEARFMKSQIKKGKKTFAAYAKSHSKHKASAVHGGDMGWVSGNKLLPEISKALKNMKSKKNIKLIQTSTSVRLIQLLETRASSVIPLANVQPLLIEKMRTQKQQALNQAYLAALLKKNPVSIKDFKLLKKAMGSSRRDTFKSKGKSIIATMGSVKLNLNDVLQQINLLESVQHVQVSNMNDAFVKDTLIGNALLERFVVSKAKHDGFDKQDDVVLRVGRAVDNVLIEAKLQKMTILPASFPSEKQLAAAYDQNKAKFAHPDMVHMGQIFIAKTKDKDQNKKLIKAVKDLHQLLVKKPEMFAALAKRYSQNVASKNNNGDMGWLKFDTLLPEFKAAAKQMKPGMISSMIKTKQGWHIVKLFGFTKAGVYSMAEVKSKLQIALRQTEQKQRVQKKSASFLSSKSISIDQDEMGKLL